MVWVVPLLAMDLRTHCLTANKHLPALGVRQGLVGGEAP